MRADELRGRIERVYMAVSREAEPRGALSWFARRAGVSTDTVSNWVNGHTAPGGPVLALLECMERETEL